MNSTSHPTRGLAAVFALLLAATASLLRAADPVPFPPMPTPEPDHVPPQLVQRVEPVYPVGVDETRERRIYVAFLVAADGTVRNASAMFGPPAAFATAAVEAVSQWKFEPGRMAANKKPVWTQMTVELSFKPSAAAKPPQSSS
ncbi:MAG: energy transducer TonB [Opitutae bacterium]|nr:energy transducer TonB [Opitutae bacterium]